MTIREHVIDFIKKIHHGTDGYSVRTGLEGLDKLIGRLKSGHIYILYSYKGMGATTLIIHWIANILQQEKQSTSITFFNLDAHGLGIAERLVAHFSKVSLENIQNVRLSNYERDVLVEDAVTKLRHKPLVVDDAYADMDLIESKIKFLHYTGNAGIVFIDSLQLIVNTFGLSPSDHYEDCLKRLKTLSTSLGMPIVIACELAGDNDNERPQMTKIQVTINEKHSDVAMCLWRPEYYEHQRGETELLVLKNNFGTVGSVKLISDFETQSFAERI